MNSPGRLEKNLEILDKLFHYIKENPTIRFGQALSNLNLATHRGVTETETNIQGKQVIVPYFMGIFYEEPEETLTKMRNV